MFKNHIRSLLFLILTATLALSISCTRKGRSNYGLDINETLRVALETEPPTLDWHKATDTTSSTITTNIMDGLVDYDLADPNSSIRPSLAASWSSSSDQRVWTFTLQEGVRWTDGVEFTAQHVVDGWERLLDPMTASEYAYFLFNIKNAEAYNKGDITDFEEVGVKVNDEGQLVVELEQPKTYFPMLLTHSSTYPVRKDIVEKHGDAWTRPNNIVTIGPYKLKVWDHDRALVLERNEDYFGEPAKLKNVLFFIINELSTALNMFERGELDALNSVPSLELSRIRELPQYKNHPILGIYYLGFNTTVPPLDNKLVRRALNMAIDREEITNLLAGGQKPITGWLPVGMMGHNPDVGLKFDPEKAKATLDEAGFQDRSQFPRIVLGFNTNENHQRLAENVQAQLRRNLGINIELNNEEWKVYLSSLRMNPPAIFRLGWIGDYPDPDNFLNLMTSTSDNNHTRWGNERFDRLVRRAASMSNQAEREKLYLEAQKLLVEDEVPVIPIYSYTNNLMIADRVENYPMSPMHRFDYRGVSLRGEK